MTTQKPLNGKPYKALLRTNMICALALAFAGASAFASADGGTWPASTATANWVGGASDALMTTMGNWEGSPASLDLIGGTLDVNVAAGGEMKYSGTTWLASITNSVGFVKGTGSTVTPSWIEPQSEGDTLVLSRGLYSGSDKNQIVLKGRISLPNGVSGGAARLDNPCAIKYIPSAFNENTEKPSGVIEGHMLSDGATRGSAPLVLAGASIDCPLWVRGVYLSTAVLGYTDTSNVVNGAYYSDISQSAVGLMSGSSIDFRGGFSSEYKYRFVGDNTIGDTMVRIIDKPLCIPNDNTLALEYGPTVEFDAEDCYARNGIAFLRARVVFKRSWCFKDGTTPISESYHTRYYASQLEFNTTTQRFSTVALYNTNADSYFNGDYPAMLEATCEASDHSASTSTNEIPINGGLGIHVCGSGTFSLAKQNYVSCGDLEASAGTLMLCNDATWLNGTNFTARGTGCIKFTKAGQVNSDFAKIRLADSGTIEIPAGVTLAVQSLEVFSNGGWRAVSQPNVFDGSSTGPMAGRITGGGDLRVLGNKSGFVLILR